jgi:hypothetical protein
MSTTADTRIKYGPHSLETTAPDLIAEIKSQFPDNAPAEDYQSQYTFAVLLDIKDWRRVLTALDDAGGRQDAE